MYSTAGTIATEGSDTMTGSCAEEAVCYSLSLRLAFGKKICCWRFGRFIGFLSTGQTLAKLIG